VFNALELDDIRIERLDDIESNYKTNIKVLKVNILLSLNCFTVYLKNQDKLAFHRKKKTNVQTDRDIKVKIGMFELFALSTTPHLTSLSHFTFQASEPRCSTPRAGPNTAMHGTQAQCLRGE
jgi:hypothetical protein